MPEDSGTPDKPRLPSDEEIADRFERIRDELKGMELPDLPETEVERLQTRPEVPDIDHAAIDAKLDKFEHRVKMAKGGYHTAINKPSVKNLAEDNKNARGLAMGMTIAYTIMGFPMLGVGIGWLIDWRLGTVMGKGIGILIGGTLGVYMAIKMVNESANK